MKSVYIVGGLIISGFLSACNVIGEPEGLDYGNSQVTPTLEIPPDLISRSTNENLDLPGTRIGQADNNGKFVETGYLGVEARALPTFSSIKIDGQGDLHWLVVSEKVEILFPLIREFWAEQGFLLQVDEPAAGVLETNWLSLKSGDESFLGSLFSSFAYAESRDQFKTRFTRSTTADATHIYLAHRGQEVAVAEDIGRNDQGGVLGWQYVDPDPSKEHEMLYRMMIFLGMQDEAVKKEMSKLGLFAARSKIAFDEDDGITYLIVKDGFDKTWNRLIHRLDRRSIKLNQVEREDDAGQLAFEFASLDIEKVDQEDNRDSLQLRIEGDDSINQTRIDVVFENNTLDQSEQAKQVLQFLRQELK